MTTPAAERLYEEQHVAKWEGCGWAVYNPHDKPIEELPIIYGFNNGSSPGGGWAAAQLLAENGVPLGSHLCSSEAYMPYDLGVLEGSRPERHKTFREHYPDGYRMEFVGYDEIESHKGLQAAIVCAALNRHL